MTIIIHPAIVIANQAFIWRINAGPANGTWTVTRKLNGEDHSSAGPTGLNARGNALYFNGTLPLGVNDLTFTISSGEVIRKTVRSVGALEFIWKPTFGASVSMKPQTQSIDFGDGYRQINKKGINNKPSMWDLSFNGVTAETGRQIDDFLNKHEGALTFLWRTLDGDDGMFLCSEWTRSFDGEDKCSVHARFEQLFQ